MGSVESNLTKECFGGKIKKKQIENISEDDMPIIKGNTDGYFTKSDINEIKIKYPDYEKWLRTSTLELRENKPKAKRIKWKASDVIGIGSYGRVLFGLNIENGQLMAVKQVDIGNRNDCSTQEKIKSLELEIDILSLLSHKNIVRYIGSSRTKSTFNIFLEYVTGGHTISSLLEKYGKFNENLIRIYTKQIVEGLEYLHVRNTIHRDIKGSNILVDNNGVCKLADFGTAKKISLLVDKSMANSLRGTVYWMAPEVMKQKALGRQSDIWSLGCTVVEMATGKPPWYAALKGQDQIATMYQIAKSKSSPPIPIDLSPEAQDFLRRCLRVDAKERSNITQLMNHKFIQDDEPLYLEIRETFSYNSELSSPYSTQSSAGKISKIPIKKSKMYGLGNQMGNSADKIRTILLSKSDKGFIGIPIKQNRDILKQIELKAKLSKIEDNQKIHEIMLNNLNKSSPINKNDLNDNIELIDQNFVNVCDKETDLSTQDIEKNKETPLEKDINEYDKDNANNQIMQINVWKNFRIRSKSEIKDLKSYKEESCANNQEFTPDARQKINNGYCLMNEDHLESPQKNIKRARSLLKSIMHESLMGAKTNFGNIKMIQSLKMEYNHDDKEIAVQDNNSIIDNCITSRSTSHSSQIEKDMKIACLDDFQEADEQAFVQPFCEYDEYDRNQAQINSETLNEISDSPKLIDQDPSNNNNSLKFNYCLEVWNCEYDRHDSIKKKKYEIEDCNNNQNDLEFSSCIDEKKSVLCVDQIKDSILNCSQDIQLDNEYLPENPKNNQNCPGRKNSYLNSINTTKSQDIREELRLNKFSSWEIENSSRETTKFITTDHNKYKLICMSRSQCVKDEEIKLRPRSKAIIRAS